MKALEQANAVRLARAERKREIARGDLAVEDVILQIPMELESISLAELLQAQKRWGRHRVRKFLMIATLAENKKLGTLTPRQQSLLAREVVRAKGGAT